MRTMINIPQEDRNAIILCVVISLSAILIATLLWQFIRTETNRADTRDQLIISTNEKQTHTLSIYLAQIADNQKEQIKSQTRTNEILDNMNQELYTITINTAITATQKVANNTIE
jgi:hypothetical protein